MSAPAQSELPPSIWHMVLPLIGIVSAVLLAAALLTYGTKAPLEAAPTITSEPYQIILPEGWDSQSRNRTTEPVEDL